VNFRWLRIAPVLIVSITIAAISLSEWLAGTGRLAEIRQLELLTFDWRPKFQHFGPEIYSSKARLLTVFMAKSLSDDKISPFIPLHPLKSSRTDMAIRTP